MALLMSHIRNHAYALSTLSGIIGIVDAPRASANTHPQRIHQLSQSAVLLLHSNCAEASLLVQECFPEPQDELTIERFPDDLDSMLFDTYDRKFPGIEIGVLAIGINSEQRRKMFGWNSRRGRNSVINLGPVAQATSNPLLNFLTLKIYSEAMTLERGMTLLCYTLAQSIALGLEPLDGFASVVTITPKEGVSILGEERIEQAFIRAGEIHSRLLTGCSSLFAEVKVD